MHILKILFAVLSSVLTLSCMSADAFAFYRAQSETIGNAFGLSRILYITLDPGSGTGTSSGISLALNDAAVLPDNRFTKKGYHFNGWGTSQDGSVISDASALSGLAGDATELTLYALWAPNCYTVSFKDNVVSGTVPDAVSCTYDTASALPSYSAVSDDMLFLGWNTKADGSGSTLSPAASIYNLTDADGVVVTLYAVWEDESGGLIETNWTKQLDADKDDNGTADRLELKPGSTTIKDPSVKNLTDKDCYAYIAVSVPSVSACLSGETTKSVHDIAVLNITPHWKLISSEPAASASESSVYIYRYDTVLKAHGSSAISSNHTLRHADRSTDLMTGFTIQDFSTYPAINDSIDVEALLIEAVVAESEADKLAKLNLSGT